MSEPKDSRAEPRDAELVSLYQGSRQELPPAGTDALILRAAREQAQRSAQTGWNWGVWLEGWTMPVASAAVVMLAVAAVALLQLQHDVLDIHHAPPETTVGAPGAGAPAEDAVAPEVPVPAVPPQAVAPVAEAPLTDELAPHRAVDSARKPGAAAAAKRESAQAADAAGDAAMSSIPSKEAARAARNVTAGSRRPAASSADAGPQSAPAAAPRAGAATAAPGALFGGSASLLKMQEAPAGDDGSATPAPASERPSAQAPVLSPLQWLYDIRAMLDAGDDAAARQAYAAFSRRYPDFPATMVQTVLGEQAAASLR